MVTAGKETRMRCPGSKRGRGLAFARMILATAFVAGCDVPSTGPEIVAPEGFSRLLVPGGRFTQVSAGNDHTCALRDDGVVECWGDNGFGKAPATRTAVTGAFTNVSAGGLHTCATRSDGVVECWGLNSSNQAPPTRSPSTGAFIAIDVGTDHSCALRGDGVVGCWGNNNLGKAPSIRSAGTGIFSQVTAAAVHTCATRDDGVVECWGSSTSGQAPPTKTPAASQFVQASGGNLHTCAVRGDGVVECWGNNGSGRAPALKTALAGVFTQVSAGLSHTCARRSDGVVECWGNSLSGQAPATKTATTGTFVQVTSGANHSCALRSDGIVQCWGTNTDGQAPGTREPSIRTRVMPTATFSAPSSVSEGESFGLALSDAQVPGYDGSPFTYAFDCGSGYGDFSSATTTTCPPMDGPQLVAVKASVRDREGDTQEHEAVVAVENMAPTIEALLGDEIMALELYQEGGLFHDPGADTHTATIEYGDGTSPAPLALSEGGFELAHTYQEPGVFTVLVEVTDSDGATAQQSTTVTVLSTVSYFEWLGQAVAALTESGVLTRGWGPRLRNDIIQAERWYERGRYDSAISALDDFIEKVEDCLARGVLEAEEGTPLIETAEQLKAVIQGL